MEKLTAKEFVNNKLGDKNYTHSAYPMYRDEIEEWIIEYVALTRNLSLGNVMPCLSIKEMSIDFDSDGDICFNIEGCSQFVTKKDALKIANFLIDNIN